MAENEIRSLSPRLSELIITRSMAWSVRAQAGTSGQMIKLDPRPAPPLHGLEGRRR